MTRVNGSGVADEREERIVDAYLQAIDPRQPDSDRERIVELEAQFLTVAASFGRRRGIERATWLAVGVPPGVLNRAGIER